MKTCTAVISTAILLFSSTNIALAYTSVPGMALGARHNVNQSTDDFPIHGISAERLHGGDRGAPSGVGYEWDHVYDNPAANMFDYESDLPPGVTFGLRHSLNQPHYQITTFGLDSYLGPQQSGFLKKKCGGDLGAPSGHGYCWYETGTSTNFNSSILDNLPPGTMVGLKHSLNQPYKTINWNGQVYDPSNLFSPVPQGFVRKTGGDLGAPAMQGYWWFEKN